MTVWWNISSQLWWYIFFNKYKYKFPLTIGLFAKKIKVNVSGNILIKKKLKSCKALSRFSKSNCKKLIKAYQKLIKKFF